MGQAQADLTTFTAQADWETALVRNQIASVTFDDFTSRTSFADAPLDIGPFTLKSNIAEPFSTDNSSLIDVAPFFVGPTNDGTPINATPYVRIGVNNDQLGRGDTTVTLVFDNPITAWGADFTAAATREQLDLALYTLPSEAPIIIPVEINTGFFGFLLAPNSAITEVEFRSRLTLNGTERFGIDNISFVSIPEPSSFLTLGLITLGLRRRY